MSNDRRYPLIKRSAYLDASGFLHLNGAATTSLTSPSAGAAGALPATPAGYLSVVINAVTRKIPYY